ncbi:Hypothetical predicted protein [Pelobates cultripes]|uniref:Uncharacterized protein n=1 Tax=Pelobates cultripes TaxID=61616 RepID=A0AAD1WIX7_PELCU|nr:Hypothetical predicted protein [Pelobates cultripes]
MFYPILAKHLRKFIRLAEKTKKRRRSFSPEDDYNGSSEEDIPQFLRKKIFHLKMEIPVPLLLSLTTRRSNLSSNLFVIPWILVIRERKRLLLVNTLQT